MQNFRANSHCSDWLVGWYNNETVSTDNEYILICIILNESHQRSHIDRVDGIDLFMDGQMGLLGSKDRQIITLTRLVISICLSCSL